MLQLYRMYPFNTQKNFIIQIRILKIPQQNSDPDLVKYFSSGQIQISNTESLGTIFVTNIYLFLCAQTLTSAAQ